MDLSNLTGRLSELFAVYGLRFVYAIVILIIGRFVAKGIRRLIRRVLTRSNVEETLIKFVESLSYIALLAFVVVAALNQLGIQTASFIAVLGAAGLAIGLALQGSLSNFAAGVLMIIFKPFKVGDYVEGAGVAGTVEKVQIFTTQLKSPDNKTIIVPNAKIMSDNITNYTVKGTRRVDLVFGIGYGDDIDKARNNISQIIAEDERVLDDPAPVIVVSALAESSVDLTVRVWTTVDNYWNFYFDTIEKVKKHFDQEDITIPFPQRDVHIYQQ